ncbi:methyltransferase domain-containing protein [Cryobacterium fucosi]|uniref:Methyltransferase domain-containing protein n=1 Tax=Cryobacterium fucosi TaxID=1259157 RepID=A0A4R9B3V9_9MICO|nr:methyltransferase domain-containing protein [Cryobacterium fucosi]TFD75388.1 methyltransferase domain-containing protein [Cryobacterium fucosi]
MSLQTLSEWLRCPICFLPLEPGGPLILRCANGHAYDANKRGYVSLAGGSRRLIGDSAAMLDARDEFLAAGWYGPLRDSLAELIVQENPATVLDVGCGTGYYLRGVLARLPGTRALGMDLSPVAVARTVAGEDRIDGLVADVWAPIPVRDDSVDVILNVFAPRNPAEFHRMLRPGGLLVVVVPQETHLRELRDAGLALGVQANKTAELTASLDADFVLESRATSSELLTLGPGQVGSLVGMGPSAHHTDAATLADEPDAGRPVTVAFELLGFRRRG